tara:strand:+ start:443 stop:619 length:177 start_codon:yes stop_codon:yes gene_type:complete
MVIIQDIPPDGGFLAEQIIKMVMLGYVMDGEKLFIKQYITQTLDMSIQQAGQRESFYI